MAEKLTDDALDELRRGLRGCAVITKRPEFRSVDKVPWVTLESAIGELQVARKRIAELEQALGKLQSAASRVVDAAECEYGDGFAAPFVLYEPLNALRDVIREAPDA